MLLLTPLHWLLLSLAAWRALYQLLVAPYRLGEDRARARPALAAQRRDDARPIKLEHYLSKLKKRGKLPVLAENSRSFKRRNFTRGRTAP